MTMMVCCSVDFLNTNKLKSHRSNTKINAAIKLNVLRNNSIPNSRVKNSDLLVLSHSLLFLKPIIFSMFCCLIQVNDFAVIMMMKQRII